MSMMNTDEHDKLWHLLGKAKPTGASPFFARDVLREVRLAKQEKSGLFAWLGRKWAFTTIGAVAAVLLTFNTSHFHRTSDPEVTLLAQQISDKSDIDVINHLDELVASEENSVWLENSSP